MHTLPKLPEQWDDVFLCVWMLMMPSFLLDVSTLLQQEPTFYIVMTVIFGMLVGSFLNVVIHRMPIMMQKEWEQSCQELQGKEPEAQEKYTLVTPRSACPKCGHNITALENIPVISYLFLRGKCSGCKTPISMRYPLIETLTGALAGCIAYQFGYTGMAFFALIFMFVLIALTFIDFDTQLLPDDLTLPLMWLGILYNLNTGFTDLSSSVVGAVAGYMILWSVFWLFKIVTGKEGMGYGDFKLLAAIGAWFGWKMLPAVILMSSVVGSVVGIALIVFAKHGRSVPIPFGPYLALGGIAALFFGPELAQFYLPQH